MAILPIIVYFYTIYSKGINFRKITSDNLLRIKQYFILSQINDWNIQTIIDNFTKTIFDISSNSDSAFDFPLDKFIEWLTQNKKRQVDLFEVNFTGYQWFSLKILTPNRVYQFDPDIRGRFNPEIDHIFPLKLDNQSEEYYNSVDIIWNMQPVKGDINNLKRKRHPKDFFSNEGAKYLKTDYDLMPSYDIKDEIWDNPIEFVRQRRDVMLEYFKREYALNINPSS